MTEAEARRLLRDWPSIGGVEAWMAGQPWRAMLGGWSVDGEWQGWRFRVELIDDGLRVIAYAPSGRAPATWVIP